MIMVSADEDDTIISIQKFLCCKRILTFRSQMFPSRLIVQQYRLGMGRHEIYLSYGFPGYNVQQKANVKQSLN